MTSGTRKAIKALALAAICLLPGLPACAAESFGLPALMQTLASKTSGKARFTETKYLAVVDQPVESSGVLSFAAPDKLEKRTLKPRAESMQLEGDQLTLEAGNRKRVLSLKSYPQIAAFVEGIRATLVGDRTALEKVYSAELEGSEARWKLSLRPREQALQAIVSRIDIIGRQAEVRRIEIEQADGDRSVMQVEAE